MSEYSWKPIRHLAGLVVAEHFAGAADFQVVHGQIEAAAQFFHLLDGVQAALRLLGQRLHVVHQQIGIGLVVRTADAAAQLVQLRQAELVGAVHDDGVGGRHVDAGFDDRGAQQDVEALGDEVAHHFPVALVHLAVRHADARFRQQLGQHGQAVLDGFHFVVQEVDLAAALEFAQAGFADDGFARCARRS
jgi:hypothetical protein